MSNPSIVDRTFKELAAAKTALAKADSLEARAAAERATVEKPAATFNTDSAWKRNAEDARLIAERRTAQTAFDEATRRHTLAVEHAKLLDKVPGATAAAVQADAEYTAGMWTLGVDEHLRRLPVLFEKFAAMDAALAAISLPVRLVLHLTRAPELSWRGCGLTRGDVLVRMKLILDRRAIEAHRLHARTFVENIHLPKPILPAPVKAKGKAAEARS